MGYPGSLPRQHWPAYATTTTPPTTPGVVGIGIISGGGPNIRLQHQPPVIAYTTHSLPRAPNYRTMHNTQSPPPGINSGTMPIATSASSNNYLHHHHHNLHHHLHHPNTTPLPATSSASAVPVESTTTIPEEPSGQPETPTIKMTKRESTV